MLPANQKPKVADIYAAQKIIADISSGLYRSPAAAIKELVSNAYDADAEKVIIETDVPRFRTLVVRDDGNGMSINQFIYVMNHIGGSRKRIVGGEVTLNKNRKIIGRIGIGMLAVAQLGFRFYVTSTVAGVPTRFIAEVNLEPFHKDDAALVSMGRMKENSDEVLIGAVRYVDDIPEEEDAHYTIITIPDTRKGFISEITNPVREAVGAKEIISSQNTLISDFNELIEVTRSEKRADTSLDGYYYMLWELGNLCPVNYSEKGPFETIHREIENVDKIRLPRVEGFRVLIDGIEIKRPQMFPSKCAFDYGGPKPKIYPLSFDREIAGRRFMFYGYVYAQQPRIDPEGLLGIHIRIRNVGIGKYDRTWLGYPFDEGIKFGQLSGEIFVEEGLESALNIDRDSFKETDVHYQALRAYIWDKLRTEIFPEFKIRQRKYREERNTLAHIQFTSKFNEKVAQLPAPVITQRTTIVPISQPNALKWVEFSESSFKIDKQKWEKLISETDTSSSEAQERLKRVLQVLVSSELLNNVSDEDLENLLQALAVAVQ